MFPARQVNIVNSHLMMTKYKEHSSLVPSQLIYEVIVVHLKCLMPVFELTGLERQP